MYDLVIIGAGWAGFNGALRAKSLKLKTAIIDNSFLGGTCLNKGCIPAKTLIYSSRLFSIAGKFPFFGLENVTPGINFLKVQDRKDRLVESLRLGMNSMLKGVDFFNAKARLLGPGRVLAGENTLETKYILIATGSICVGLEGWGFDGGRIISSDDILSLKEVPPSLLVIGGGVIGCEFASLFSNLGSSVSIVEKARNLLPGEDPEVSRKIEALFKRRGIKVHAQADISGINTEGFSKILVAVGRLPNIDLPGISEAGVEIEENRIKIDEYSRTTAENVYAAGDCASSVMLANFAGYQGALAVDNMVGSSRKMEPGLVPNAVFTDPEIASVGLSEDAALRRNMNITVSRFDYLGSAMARILDETQGFVKLISEKDSGILLGGTIIGPKATEIVGILSLGVSSRLSVRDLRNAIFAHPTIAESIGEALR